MSDLSFTAPHGALLYPGAPAKLPLLASTHFCMDILLQGPVLDLRSLREVVTHDPCAMLRLFQQAALASPDPDEAPRHLDECIVVLGLHGLQQALAGSPSTWQQQARLQSFASHATTIARAAQILAATLALEEETAFLVGAFHELGSLSATLSPGEKSCAPLSSTVQLQRLCDEHHLPEPLQVAVLSVAAGDPASPWTQVIDAAHQLTDAGTHDGMMTR